MHKDLRALTDPRCMRIQPKADAGVGSSHSTDWLQELCCLWAGDETVNVRQSAFRLRRKQRGMLNADDQDQIAASAFPCGERIIPWSLPLIKRCLL